MGGGRLAGRNGRREASRQLAAREGLRLASRQGRAGSVGGRLASIH